MKLYNIILPTRKRNKRSNKVTLKTNCGKKISIRPYSLTNKRGKEVRNNSKYLVRKTTLIV